MPLLKGNLDPQRFNSTTLAYELWKAQISQHPSWGQISEDEKMNIIDQCQRVINSLATQGIIE